MSHALEMPGPDEVHVWVGRSDDLRLSYSTLAASLSPAELERAAQFRAEPDRLLFVAAHGVLRVLLGRYLQKSPRQVSIQVTATGKPELVSGPGADDLRFSLSHTRGGLMLGFATQIPVGVDIENVEREVDIESLQGLVLHAEERDCLNALAPKARKWQFLRYWTQKEAYLKATGAGLGGDMLSFHLVQRGSSTLQSVVERGDADRGGVPWTVSQVFEERELVAAVAVACGEPSILCRPIEDIH